MKPKSVFLPISRTDRRLGVFTKTFGLSLGLVVVGMSPDSVQAASYSWAIDGGAAWDVDGSWTTANFPNGAGDVANITKNLTTGAAITLGQNITVGIINIGDTNTDNNYTVGVNGGNSLTLNNNGAGAQINWVNGANNDTIAAPIVIADAGGLAISNIVSSSRTRTISGGITGTGNLSITHNSSGGGSSAFATTTGAINNVGSLSVDVVTTTGSGATISSNIGSNVTSLTKTGLGVLGLSGSNAFTGGVTISAGTVNLGSVTALNGSNVVSVASGATFNLNNNSNTIAGLHTGTGTVTNSSATLKTLTLGGTSAYSFGGKLTQTGAGGLALAVNMTGSQTLSGSTNDYSGGTSLINGTLIVGDKSALGTGAINFSSTTSGTTPVLQSNTDLSGANKLVNALTVSNTQGTATIGGSNNLETSGKVILSSGGSRTLTVNNTGITTFSGLTALTNTDTSGRTATINGSGNLVITGGITNNDAGTNTNSTALTYSGTGTLTLAGANSYTGLTTVSSGTVKQDYSAATAPTSNIINSGNALTLGGGAGGTLSVTGKSATANTQTLGVLTVGAGANQISYTPGATGGTTAVTFTGATSISNASRGFIQFGTQGTTTLSNAADLSKALLVHSTGNAYATYGTNDWAATNGSGVVQAATYTDAAANYAGTTDATRKINITGSFTASGSSNGARTVASLRFADATGRTLTLSGTHTVGGILVASTAGASTITGGTLRGLDNSSTHSDWNVVQNSSNDFTISSQISAQNRTTLQKSGSGRLILTNTTNSYNGTSILAGVLSVSANTHLGSETVGTTGVILNGGILEATNDMSLDNGTNFRTVTLTSTSGLYAASGKTLTLNSSSTISGAGGLKINGSYSANGGTINDTGTVVLGGANTYAGATTVNAGKLVVSGSIGNSAVTVTGTNTTLASGTTGTIGSSVTINSGAILAAGNTNAIGTATVGSGGTTLNSGSIFSWDLNVTTPTSTASATSYDNVVTSSLSGDVGGASAVFAVVLTGGQSFSDAFWTTNHSWDNIFSTTGLAANALGMSSVFSSFTYNGSESAPVSGSFTFTGTGGNTLSWSAVPEPTSTIAGLLLGAGLLRRRRN